MALSQDKPPFDFQEFVDNYGSEEMALWMLQTFEPKIISPLYDLFDCILYKEVDKISFCRIVLLDTVAWVDPYPLANLCRGFRKYINNLNMLTFEKNMPVIEEKMHEIIKECRRLHVYVCELLKMPKDKIDALISMEYEIFDWYFEGIQSKIYFNYENLVEMYEEETWNMIRVARQTLQERNYFNEIYDGLLEQKYKELRIIGDSLKGMACYICADMLTEASQDLQDYAKEQDEEGCYRAFVDIIEQSLILERYMTVYGLQRGEKAERWISVRPEFMKFIENKTVLPSMIREIKMKRGVSEAEIQELNLKNEQNRPINFQEFMKKCVNESQAISELETQERKFTLTLYKLFDCMIYDDFQGTLSSAEEIHSQARYLEAHRLGDLCLAFMVACGKKSKSAVKWGFRELIVESKRVHIYVFKLLKLRKRNDEYYKTYEIIDVYLDQKSVYGHLDYARLIYFHGQDWKQKLGHEHYKYAEEGFLGRMFAEIIQQDYSKLKFSAHELGKNAKSVYQEELEKVCDRLEKEAQNQNEEACFKALIDVVEECLFLERYEMMNRFERSQPTEKWIKLPEGLSLLIQKKHRLSEAIREIKTENQTDKENKLLNKLGQEEVEEEESKEGYQLAPQEDRNGLHNDHTEVRILGLVEKEKELVSEQEEQKIEVSNSSVIRSRVQDMQIEYKEDVIDLSVIPSRKLDHTIIENKVAELNRTVMKKNEDEIKVSQDENIVIVSSQKAKNTEDDNYFPFDTGMKCAMF